MHSVLLYVRKKEADKNCGIARVSPRPAWVKLSACIRLAAGFAVVPNSGSNWNASIADRAYTARLSYNQKNTR